MEFSKSGLKKQEIETRQEKRDYIRGYFDAEGSVPRSPEVRPYIYFAQQDKKDLKKVKKFIEEF
ncbi:MAG: LAGLIDADG family homing endonuclease [Candidatus Aenigmatarchaeota archaeon]